MEEKQLRRGTNRTLQKINSKTDIIGTVAQIGMVGSHYAGAENTKETNGKYRQKEKTTGLEVGKEGK